MWSIIFSVIVVNIQISLNANTKILSEISYFQTCIESRNITGNILTKENKYDFPIKARKSFYSFKITKSLTTVQYIQKSALR